jgi:hypothetical protein
MSSMGQISSLGSGMNCRLRSTSYRTNQVYTRAVYSGLKVRVLPPRNLECQLDSNESNFQKEPCSSLDTAATVTPTDDFR